MSQAVFMYNCENSSLKDIIEFIQEQGYEVEYYDRRDGGPRGPHGFSVRGVDLEVRAPDLELFKDKKLWNSYGPPAIYWNPFGKLHGERYYARESGDKKRIAEAEKKYEEYHTKAKKLYNQLKRRFAIKKGSKGYWNAKEWPQSIKDEAYIRSLGKK